MGGCLLFQAWVSNILWLVTVISACASSLIRTLASGLFEVKQNGKNIWKENRTRKNRCVGTGRSNPRHRACTVSRIESQFSIFLLVKSVRICRSSLWLSEYSSVHHAHRHWCPACAKYQSSSFKRVSDFHIRLLRLTHCSPRYVSVFALVAEAIWSILKE